MAEPLTTMTVGAFLTSPAGNALVGVLSGIAAARVDKHMIDAFLDRRVNQDIQQVLQEAWVEANRKLFAYYRASSEYDNLAASKRELVDEWEKEYLKSETVMQLFPPVHDPATLLTASDVAQLFKAPPIQVNKAIIAGLKRLNLWDGLPGGLQGILGRHLLDGLTYHFVEIGIKGKPKARAALFFQQFIALRQAADRHKEDLVTYWRRVQAEFEQLDGYQGWTRDVLTEIKATTSRIDKTTSRIDERTERINETTSRIDETTSRIDETTSRIEQASKRIDSRSEQINETTSRTEAKVEDVGDQVTWVGDKVEALQEAITVSAEESAETRTNILKLEGQTARIDARFGQLVDTFARASYRIRDQIYDFSLYIEQKTHGFVGRQWVFDAVNRFINNNARGYFFIIGEPGIGKSALAAQLVKQNGYVHHFNIRAEGINKTSTFLKNVSAQLIAAYELEYDLLPPETTDDAGFLKKLLRQVSQKLSASTRCVIVVDALDEVNTIGFLGVNLLYLPLTVPKGIYIVMTMRNKPRIMPRLNCEYDQLLLQANSSDNLRDVEELVQAATIKPGIQQYILTQGIETEEFVTLMRRKSEGNFICLSYMLSEIESRAQEVTAIPTDLQRYYGSLSFCVVHDVFVGRKANLCIGKSALAAQLVKQNGYVHHFNIRAEGINKTSTFLKNVSAQLIAAYGLKYGLKHALKDEALPPQTTHNAEFLNKLLGEVSDKLMPGERCVIVVDALDEVDSVDTPTNANLLDLQLTLPKGVYIVITMRDGSHIMPHVVCERDELRILADSSDNLDDVRDFVQSTTVRSGIEAYILTQGIETQEFVTLMVDKSEGNFIYLHYVLPEIERGAYKDQKLAVIPQGLQNYYEYHWRCMRGEDEEAWFEYKLPIIMALTAVKEPLSMSLIADFSGIRQQECIRSVLREWKQFLHEKEVLVEGDFQKQYYIYHTTFHDFIARKEEVGDERVDRQATYAKIADALWHNLFDDE